MGAGNTCSLCQDHGLKQNRVLAIDLIIHKDPTGVRHPMDGVLALCVPLLCCHVVPAEHSYIVGLVLKVHHDDVRLRHERKGKPDESAAAEQLEIEYRDNPDLHALIGQRSPNGTACRYLPWHVAVGLTRPRAVQHGPEKAWISCHRNLCLSSTSERPGRRTLTCHACSEPDSAEHPFDALRPHSTEWM